MNPEIEELQTLLIGWEAGSLDEQDVERVREILRNNEEARAFYIQTQMIGAALQLESDSGLDASVLESKGAGERSVVAAESHAVHASLREGSGGLWMLRWGLGLAALAAGLAGWFLYLQAPEKPSLSGRLADSGAQRAISEPEETSQGVALVTRLVDVVWDQGQRPVEPGDALLPGRLAIKSGYAQIEFFCGATVVLEGPAELELASATQARMHRGQLRAQVPPAARGFSVEVDDTKVVDLGTEFGLSVSPDGADFQVFDGEIELHRPLRESQSLTAGQAITRKPDGVYTPAAATPERFLGIGDLQSRAQGQEQKRYRQWRNWSHQVRDDPRLIAYYAFDNEDFADRRLQCSLRPRTPELDGAMVGASRVAGRWNRKGALEFKRPGDRVRVQIPGEYQSLTLAAWVRIDSLDRQFNSLFLTDGYDAGEPHWQILESGQLYFSVRPAERGEQGPSDHKALSPRFWKPSMSGKWQHLAVVYDVDAKKITHYLNGEVLSRELVPAQKVVHRTRIGAASIGNWSLPTLPDARFAVRNLNGSIDEFALFGGALNRAEIRQMYRQGKP